MKPIVTCRRITKSYSDLVAVSNVSLSIEKGEIFGLVGPNRAGKTTLVEMIEGLRIPDHGTIKVLGLNPIKQSNAVKDRRRRNGGRKGRREVPMQCLWK